MIGDDECNERVVAIRFSGTTVSMVPSLLRWMFVNVNTRPDRTSFYYLKLDELNRGSSFGFCEVIRDRCLKHIVARHHIAAER